MYDIIEVQRWYKAGYKFSDTCTGLMPYSTWQFAAHLDGRGVVKNQSTQHGCHTLSHRGIHQRGLINAPRLNTLQMASKYLAFGEQKERRDCR